MLISFIKSRYSGLIFTSKNSVRALEMFLLQRKENSMILSSDDSNGKLPCFPVGKGTAAELRKMAVSWLDLVIMGEKDSIDAESLASTVVHYCEEKGKNLPWLFMCGSIRRDIIPLRIKQAGFCCQEVYVYETRIMDKVEISAELNSFMVESCAKVLVIVFFSPSGVDAAFDSIVGHVAGQEIKVLFACIGKTTGKHLKDKLAFSLAEDGVYVVCIAQRPEPESLFEAVKEALAQM